MRAPSGGGAGRVRGDARRDFGEAMLRGMGWQEGRCVGKQRQGGALGFSPPSMASRPALPRAWS